MLYCLLFVFIILTLAWLAGGAAASVSPLQETLMWIDVFNISVSYMAFIAMGWRGFTGHERTRMKGRWLLLTPAYWLMMSFAGWRALIQLISNTHLWEKTPHTTTPEWAALAEAAESLKNTQGMERVKGIEPSS